MKKSLEGTVKALEGEDVILSFSDGQTVKVPVEACEGTPAVGQSVRVVVAVLGSEDAGRQALARELLNEILGS